MEKKGEKGNTPAVINGFGGVFDLEDTAIWRESSDGEIVTSSYAAHLGFLLLSVFC